MNNQSLSTENQYIEPLTRRERQILGRLAQELSNREIAEAETLALSSVKWYIQQIYGKLGVNNRRQALERGREAGLLDRDLTPTPQNLTPEPSSGGSPSPNQKPDLERGADLLPLQRYPSTGEGWGGVGVEVLPTGTVTFLFTDIVGSTPLWEKHPDEMALALQIHNAVLQQAIEANGGIVFKTVGDAIQAAFATALDGLKAASAGQGALQAAAWNELGELKVRMGLHTGEAALDPGGDEYAVSHTKNRAARIMAGAQGGQILLSRETRELVDHQLPEGVTLVDLGEHHLKGLARPEHLYQVRTPGLPEAFPPLATALAQPNNLPVQMTSFIGREQEIAQVIGLLANHRLVTLTGSGGTGKTRLSLQVAVQVLENYPQGVWLVELAPLTDPELVSKAVASVLDLPEISGQSIPDLLVNFLQDKRLLLILDNCEHLLEACADLADQLLQACPKLAILASSREFLGVEGELPYRVPPMSLPDPRHLPPIVDLSQFDAVHLFIERARVVVPDFDLSENNAALLVQVVSRLDGIPLAIELASARLRVLDIEQIAARLDDAFRLLTGGSRSKLPRHQTLRASIDWSYNLLSEPERILLRRLSVFAGSWSLEAAEQVCAHDLEACQPLCPEDILDLSTGLVDKSLIQSLSAADGPNRFRMLEMVRQYAGENLADENESKAIRTRHLAYYLDWAERLAPRIHSQEQIETLDRLETDLDNLRLALEWGLKTEVENELRLAVALQDFWHIRFHWSEAVDWLERGLELDKKRRGASQPTGSQTLIVARALGSLGFHLFKHTDQAMTSAERNRIGRLLEESLAMAQSIGPEQPDETWLESRKAQAWAKLWLGDSEFYSRNFTQDRAFTQDALDLFREIGDQYGMAESLMKMADLETDPERAAQLIQEAIALEEAIGDVNGVAIGLNNLAFNLFQDGDYQNVIGPMEESLDRFQQVRNPSSIAGEWITIGVAVQAMGDLGRARQSFQNSLAYLHEYGNERVASDAYSFLNLLYITEGDFEKAAETNEKAWQLAQKVNNPKAAAKALYIRTRLSRLSGYPDWAGKHAAEGQRISANLVNPEPKMLILLEQGYLAVEGGRLAEAGALWRQAIRTFINPSQENWMLFPLGSLAFLTALAGKMEAAARLIGTRWCRGFLNFLSPIERTRFEEALAAVKASLGADRFDELYEAGQRMTLTQAIALAMEEDE